MTTEPAGRPPTLLVVGTGLIGTSVALAARQAGYQVWLSDRDADQLATAVRLGAGNPAEGLAGAADLAVVAVPPAATGAVALDLLRREMARTVSHVSSVQIPPQQEIETELGNVDRFVGGHPIAGSERSGPHHASAELFRQRPWVVCPTDASSDRSIAAVERLAAAAGAAPVTMTAAAHDALLARLSHVPQLLASALAASLVGLERDQAALAGSGMQDTSRLADSEPALWAEIVSANRSAVAVALDEVIRPLVQLREALGSAAVSSPDVAAAVTALVGRGRLGRQQLAGKHGALPVRWGTVSVVVPDRPGALAQLLTDAATAAVNVEDIRVDHAPGRPLGVVELAVDSARAEELARALNGSGWAATAATAPSPVAPAAAG